MTLSCADEVAWLDQQPSDRHYPGDRPAGLGPACYALKDRDRWLRWCTTHRIERLKLIVKNRRFLVLADKGQAPNLASQTLAALRAAKLPADCQPAVIGPRATTKALPCR